MQSGRDAHSGDTGSFRETSAAGKNARKGGDRITSQGSRPRPTNNQLLYRATFQWEHYRPKLQNSPTLPLSTEACASVTSAFLQVIGVLFEVESIREDQPRNILRLLANNTRRTKVVELSSGTHRVPEELKRHFIGDGEGGQYSTNLDRNRYGVDDQYLATVVRYNLDFLELCPLLVDITILDAKGGNVTTTVSAEPSSCRCNPTAPRPSLPVDARQHRLVKTVRAGVTTLKGANEEEESWPARSARGLEKPADPQPATPEVDPGSEEAKKVQDHPLAPPSRGSGGNGPLFDALLLAAREPQQSEASPKRGRIFAPQSKDSDSQDESQDPEDNAVPQGGQLRRSSRRSKKLFNAASIEQDDSWDSEKDETSPSVDGYEEVPHKRTRASNETWDSIQRRSRSRRQSGPSIASSEAHRPRLAWTSPPDSRFAGRGDRGDSLQLEVGRLKKQLQNLRTKLLQSEQREADAQMQIEELQNSLAVQKASHHTSAGRDQKAADFQIQKSRGTPDYETPTADGMSNEYLASMLKDLQANVARLKQEKAMMQRTLLGAGLHVTGLQAGDFAQTQEWARVGGVGAAHLAPASIPPAATPSSAYSAFTIPFMQPSTGSGFKPCAQDTPSSQSHYIVPSSAALNGFRGSASQGMRETGANGPGPTKLRGGPQISIPGYIPKIETAEEAEALPNGPTKGARSMPLQDISRHANQQTASGLNDATMRKREGEEATHGPEG